MNLTCPACKKTNDIGDSVACQRCGCDLSALIGVRQAALRHLGAASEDLRSGHWRQALNHAEQSWALVHTTEAAQFACLAACALGQGELLRKWRQWT